MDIGLQFPIYHDDPVALKRFVEVTEQLGFAALWTGDHIVFPTGKVSAYPYAGGADDKRFGATESGSGANFLTSENRNFLEAVSTAGFIAGASTTINIAVGVFVVPMRNAVILGKELATLDVLSGGRLWAGVGAGWLREEFDVLGAPFAKRGARLDEAVALMRSLWGPQPAEYHGDHLDMSPVYCEPRPTQQDGPPILVGGQTPPALRRAARLGDAWLAHELEPEEFHKANQELDRLLEAEGREPVSLRRMNLRRLRLSDDGIERTRDLVGAYRDLGCDHLAVYSTPSRTVEENIDRAQRLHGDVLTPLEIGK